MAQHYAVIQQVSKWSRHGGQVTEITMVGLKDRLPYTTWVDPMNVNAAHWAHITRTPQHGFILTDVRLKRMKGRVDVINADSVPRIAWEHHSCDEMIDTVMAQWRRQDGTALPPQFDDLFRADDE